MLPGMRVDPIPCLSDNYAYLLVCPTTNEAAIVDASEPDPVLEVVRAAEDEGLRIVALLSTHHHPDHVGGNEGVAHAIGEGLRVYGHASDRGRIPAQTEFLEDGDVFSVGALRVIARHVPGHTMGAVSYVVAEENGTEGGDPPAVFTGDTLFVAGCGRLFEGTPETMTASLEKLASLDPTTRVYCGHEYTEANLAFAAHVEPSNDAVRAACERSSGLRAARRPTVPSTIGDELAINPFFRVDSPEIRRTLGIDQGATRVEAFRAVRKAKDGFRR